MILRNKKTGEIGSLKVGGSKNHYLVVNDGWTSCGKYNSLAELNAEWEDYEPKQPLIKDENIRKAVRAWAEAESEDCYYGEDATTLYNGSGDHIEFWSRPFADLKPGEHYTLDELCGEED